VYQTKINKPRILDLVTEIRGVSHGICNYICMYVDVFAKNVMYLRQDFYNTMFKININDT
jgi:hypothetical protein